MFSLTAVISYRLGVNQLSMFHISSQASVLSFLISLIFSINKKGVNMFYLQKSNVIAAHKYLVKKGLLTWANSVLQYLLGDSSQAAWAIMAVQSCSCTNQVKSIFN